MVPWCGGGGGLSACAQSCGCMLWRAESGSPKFHRSSQAQQAPQLRNANTSTRGQGKNAPRNPAIRSDSGACSWQREATPLPGNWNPSVAGCAAATTPRDRQAKLGLPRDVPLRRAFFPGPNLMNEPRSGSRSYLSQRGPGPFLTSRGITSTDPLKRGSLAGCLRSAKWSCASNRLPCRKWARCSPGKGVFFNREGWGSLAPPAGVPVTQLAIYGLVFAVFVWYP